ncbi:transcription antitermination factor NusB [Oceanicoccus sp. KOV_DT_Chl]|uniref:transcription antitermination factor NusB n=1 Tax=Oceanicoccus sp. KOV_DT_Chl TaxID=1904639 RepID=UPI00351075A6
MSKAPQDCRAAAARCLAAVANGSSLSQQIPLFEQPVSERDRPLFRQLCYGVLRFYPKLLAISQQLLKKPMKEKDHDVLMLILLGIYQLSETRIPDHAAVSATVNAIKALKKPWARALTNGVLRQWQRNQDQLLAKLTSAEQSAHPQWLHQALADAWPALAADIEATNNQQAPLCLRVNKRHQSRAAYLTQLSDHDIDAQACEFADEGVRLTQAVAVEQLPGFNKGWVSVQDEAPQLSAALMDLQQGHRVLDACCAPGAKPATCWNPSPPLKQ